MTEGRNEAGQFTEGNTFSDGRNKHLHAAELRQLFCEAINAGEIQRLAYKLMGMALDGDLQAAKLLLSTAFKDVPTVAVVETTEAPVESLVGRAQRIMAKIQAERAEMGEAAFEVQRAAALHKPLDPKMQSILDRIRGQRTAAEVG